MKDNNEKACQDLPYRSDHYKNKIHKFLPKIPLSSITSELYLSAVGIFQLFLAAA